MAKSKLLTAKDAMNDTFDIFMTDKDRIQYISNNYNKMSVAKAFGIYYSLDVSQEVKTNKTINNVQEIEPGMVYNGIVQNFYDGKLTITVPGIKEEIICKENFNHCEEAVRNYLLTHDNKILFEVRECKQGKAIVSVINAYYRLWTVTIDKAIKHEQCITAHIDSLVRGGYLCHTPITTLVELTGQNYTHSVFIPGSQIVLNVERDFNRWLGQDVMIVPQNFVEFKRNVFAGVVENSLVGSRKRILQIEGMNNMVEMYNRWRLGQTDNAKYVSDTYEGTVTGIINSNNKTGAFVELDNKYITGLMLLDSIDLVDYKPGDKVQVKIKTFEVQDGKDAFTTNKRGKVIKCNTRPVFVPA